jgi:hypothetical protein
MANPEMAAAFVKNEGKKLVAKSRQKAASEARKPRKGLKRSSQAQDYREGRLAGIKAERLFREMVAYASRTPYYPANGVWPKVIPTKPYFCERCQTGTDSLAEAHATLDLHHVTQRSLGARATRLTEGDERVEVLDLVCRPCHEDAHG